MANDNNDDVWDKWRKQRGERSRDRQGEIEMLKSKLAEAAVTIKLLETSFSEVTQRVAALDAEALEDTRVIDDLRAKLEAAYLEIQRLKAAV